MSSMIELSIYDYYELMRERYPSEYCEDSPIAEFNIRSLRNFWYLLDREAVPLNTNAEEGVDEVKVFYFGYRIGLQNLWNPKQLDFVLSSSICYPMLPFSAKQLVEGLSQYMTGALKELNVNMPVVTETFEAVGVDAYPNHFLWFNSPVVELKPTVDDYLASLNSKRRRKMKKMFEFGDVAKQVSGADYIDFIKTGLRHRWEDDLDFVGAYQQALWPIANEHKNLGRNYAVKDKDGNLLCVIYFMERLGTLIYQGMAQNPEFPVNNCGARAFAAMIKLLCGSTSIDVMDVTCKININDFEDDAIDVYKRVPINKNNLRPIMALACDEDQVGYIQPPYYLNGWQLPEERQVMFRGL